MYRDELIEEARRVLRSAGMKREAEDLQDSRIQRMEEFLYDKQLIRDSARDGEGGGSKMRQYQGMGAPKPS